MTIIEAQTYCEQDPRILAQWKLHDFFHFHAEYEAGAWSVWLRNTQDRRKYGVAKPQVKGCAVLDMGFIEEYRKPQYEYWREAVKAQFLSTVVVNYERVIALDKQGDAMDNCISTLGTFDFDGGTWAVETHPERTIKATFDGHVMAVMKLGTGSVLGPAAPGESGSAEALWLDQVREFVLRVLAGAARDGRGPWAALEPHGRV